MSQQPSSAPQSPITRLFRRPRAADLRNAGGLLALIAAAAFLGFYLALAVPPWQHYDEPTHFEAAKLIADRLRLPTAEEFDPLARRQIIGSMTEFGFFREAEGRPNLLIDADPHIGYSQIDGQSLYYALLAAPIYLASDYDVTMQLYIARVASSLHLVAVVVVAFLTAVEMFGAHSRMRWALPIAVLATPSFTENLSGLNNDAAAALIGSLLIWSSARIYRRGWTIGRAVGFAALVGAAFFTKNTILALLPFSLLLFVLRLRIRARFLLPILGVAVAAAAFVLVDANGASDWLSADGAVARVAVANGPAGSYAFEATRSESASVSTRQRIPLPSLRPGVKAIYTLGAWMWTDGVSETLPMPILVNHVTRHTVESLVAVDATPRWFTSKILLNGDWRNASVTLLAPRGSGRLYFDGVTLVAGADLQAGGELVANGSAENPSLRFRNSTTALESAMLFDPGHSIGLLQSERHRDRYLWRALQHIVESFWARFSWGNIGLAPAAYDALSVVTALSLVLTAASIFKTAPAERGVWAALWLGAISMWLSIVLRGVGSNLDLLWLPAARYGAPGILVTWSILLLGWRAVVRALPRRASVALVTASAALLTSLNVYSYATLRDFHDAYAPDSFARVRASQEDWRTAHAAAARQDTLRVNEAMQRYANKRAGNLFAEIGAAELFTQACGATGSAQLCKAAETEWRRTELTPDDALRRAETELEGGAPPQNSAGWIDIARRLTNQNRESFTCDSWRITLTSIAIQKDLHPRIDPSVKVLTPGHTLPGNELRITEPISLCGTQLGSEQKTNWGDFLGPGRAAIIIHVPVDGMYRISVNATGTFPPINGSLYLHQKRIGEFTINETSNDLTTNAWDVFLPAGWHSAAVSFDNHVQTRKNNRSLKIISLALEGLP